MVDIKKTLNLLALLEYDNTPRLFLHQNKHENTMTCGGIYEYANPTAIDWAFIKGVYKATGNDIKRTSVMLYHDDKINAQIKDWAKINIWDKMKLDEIKSQKIADEMFLFAFHTHYKTAAKVAQRVVGVVSDGFIGSKSIKALNDFDSDTFDIVYDEHEKEHYKDIIKRKPYLQMYYDGWLKRAYKI